MKPRGRPPKTAGGMAKAPRRVPCVLVPLLRIRRRVLKKLLTRPSAAAPTRAQSLHGLVENRELLATTLLTIPSAGAMLLTYRGASMLMAEHGAGLIQKGEALIFALSIGVLVFLGWAYLFSVIPRLRGGRLKGALAAGGIYVTTVACIDAPFNMLALAGASAVQMSLVDTASSYETARKSAFTQSAMARRLIPGIRTQAVRFKAREDGELKGADTGQPKPGKVSAAFSDKAKVLGTLADTLEAGLSQADALQGEATIMLARMKKQVHEQGPIRSRVEAVSIEADRIDEMLGRLAQFDMAVSIRATLKSLDGASFVPRVTTKQFEAIQNEQLAMIADMTRAVTLSLQQALDELSATPVVRADTAKPSDPMTAIKTYWWPLLPQWIAALFVDLAPALLLFILIAARREAEAAEKPSLLEGASS